MRRAGTARRRAAVLLLAAGGLLLAGCTGNAATSQAQTHNAFLVAHPAKKTIDVELLAGVPRGGDRYNFDGANDGRMTIKVPLGWTVTALCVNYAVRRSHSCAIVSPDGSTPAFKGAAIPHPARGLAPGKSASFTFVASRPGRYQVVCLVPQHREKGMWDWFDVTRGGTPKLTGARRVPLTP